MTWDEDIAKGIRDLIDRCSLEKTHANMNAHWDWLVQLNPDLKTDEQFKLIFNIEYLKIITGENI